MTYYIGSVEVLDDLPLTMIGILFVFIILSAFFSSAETAFSSVNRIRIKNYADEKRRGAQKALWITENFDGALSTILIGNNIVNIASASISTKIATDLFGVQGVVYSTFFMTVLILIFGEILPKSVAKEFAEQDTLLIAPILVILIRLLTPLNWLFIRLKNWVKPKKNNKALPLITEDEIKVMVEMSEEEGVIDNHEAELVQRSLEFNDIYVREIQMPRMDMVTIDIAMTSKDILQLFMEERYSRIPVYEGNIDNIIGILSERDFLSQYIIDQDVKVRSLLREPYFIVPSMHISDLLPELQRQKNHMAIVVDEFGGTSGLITLEDILEELVGEIWDEHDEKTKMFVQITDNKYEFHAEIDLDEFAKILQIAEPESQSNSLGGWLYEKFQHIPKKGEQIQYKNIVLTILEVEARRIRKVETDFISESQT